MVGLWETLRGLTGDVDLVQKFITVITGKGMCRGMGA